MVDEQRIQQVLLNLLSNAIKFSNPYDQIHLKVKVEREATGNTAKVDIRCKDFGAGMTYQDTQNLFKPYYRAQDQENRDANRNSHGLGLHICQQIAKKHNGKISVQSKVREGSEFTFSFVAETCDAPTANELIVPPKQDGGLQRLKKMSKKEKKKTENMLILKNIVPIDEHSSETEETPKNELLLLAN